MYLGILRILLNLICLRQEDPALNHMNKGMDVGSNGRATMIIVRALIFTVLVPGSATIVIPYLLLSSRMNLLHYDIGIFRLIGIPLIGAGAVCYLWCVWEFAFEGRGTPAIWDSPKRFVSKGLYRTVRNPMYVGVTLILTGEAITFQSLTLYVYGGLVWLGFHVFVVYYEEPHLKKKFGPPYEDYLNAVNRWIPGMALRKREPR